MRINRILWFFLIGIICLFIVNNAVPYFNFTSESYDAEDIRPFRYALVIHILFGIVAILTGPFQFVIINRDKNPLLHKRVGKLYMLAILIASAAAIYLSFYHAILYKGYITFGVGLLGLALAWLTTTGFAYAAILKRNITQHQEWMIRSYVVTCGFVVFRIVFGVLELGLKLPHIDSGNIAAWSSWSIPLLICEVLIQKNRRI